jgi:hypothetical protein
MGYASAGYAIFDPVMKKLRETGASDEAKHEIASLLIDVLQQQDWDTEDESLEVFADDPAIVRAFAEHEIYLPDTPEYRAKWDLLAYVCS